MPGIAAENLGDLLVTTQRELGEPNFTEIATDLQDHVAMRVILKKNRVEFQSGTEIQWDIMVRHSNSAANVGLYASDNVNVVDGMIQARIPWRNTTTNYAIDRRELKMNRTPRRIVDLLKARRIMALIALAEKMETNWWGFPSAADPETPLGAPYWITKAATEGFTGGTPSGYTSVANVSVSTYPRWQNWAGPYTAVSKDDLIRKMREAATKTYFRPAVDGVPTFNTGDSYSFYANYNVVGAMEEQAEAQNDNLGNDVASMDGRLMFRRAPVMYVPKLDADTTDPVYGINWGVFKIHPLRDEWMVATDIALTPGQHTVSSHHIDLTYNFACRDRRRNFVLSNGTTYPA